jgi:gamma-glutamyltranspeptidase
MKYHWNLLAALFVSPFSNASPPVSTIDNKGAVASESTICSEIGIELLKRGVRTSK